jgi:hypothetical protein
MATFADYPTQTMFNNGGDDFTLYPTQEWSSNLPFPQTTFADQQSYLNTISFDALQTPQSLTQLSEVDLAGFNPMLASKQMLALQSPEFSPTLSASHDHRNPSLLSDSGASIPSTISSAVGSPSLHTQTLDWQQMHLYSNIASQVDAGFPSTGLEYDAFSAADKSCVGESILPSSYHLRLL